jgi:hypothetical protein
MAHLPSLRGANRSREPHLPAFCRTRRPTTLVSITSLRAIHRLLLLVLLFQLTTLLLVVAGPVPPQLPQEEQAIRASLSEVPAVREPRAATGALVLPAP